MEEASTLSSSSFTQTPLKHYQRIINDRRKELALFQDVKTHVIQVDTLDWFPRENGAKHKTDYFELVTQQKACIVRRGEIFGLAIVCKNRPYDLNRDRLALMVEFGSDPTVPEGTKSIFEMLQRREFCSTNPHEWEALFDRRVGNRVEVLVRIPPNCPVGLWKLSVITWFGEKCLGQSGAMTQIHHSEDPFYILFNPFVETDPVFMPHSMGREEFLVSEVGKIYLGSHNLVQGRPWVYGQARDTVLPAVVHILDTLGKMKPSHRGDPIRVAREIAKIVCSSEGGQGVLLNRSDGNYGNGNEPFEWTGSLPILESFIKNNGQPVKYGQCWVAAGLVTTIFRVLGIPCRNVTNFVSGRDPDSSLILEKIFDEKEVQSGKTRIWNFHVWNEVWMRRADLQDSAYHGWQALDASKGQEEEGLIPRGPSPVEAIRRGDLGVGFDTGSFFSEVNADICVYLPDKASNWGFSPSESNRSQVGQLMVTKALGVLSEDTEEDFERITHHYKDVERKTDRQEQLKASQTSALRFDQLKKKGDLFFEMVDMDKGVYGQEYNVSLFIHNQSRESRCVNVSMETSSVFYTGAKAHLIKKGLGEFDLQPNELETLTMTVTCEEYIPRSVEYSHFTNLFVARVRETGQTWTGEDNFVLQKPRLEIKMHPDTPRAKAPSKLIVSFLNPLHHELTNGYFTVEAPGLIHPTKVNFKSVPPKEKAELQLDVMAWRCGPTTVVATFSSRELFNLNGAHKVTVIS